MSRNAVSIGYAVPRGDFDATVHSVFRFAANLQPTDCSRLLTLVVNDRVDLPQGIRIQTRQPFSFDTLCLGEKVTCRGGRLRFVSSSLAVDLRGARLWVCNLPSLMGDLTNPSAAAAWERAWQVLCAWQLSSGGNTITRILGFSDEIVRLDVGLKVEEAIDILVDSTQHFSLAVTPALETLIGLGTGLTPSCDDFLVGYLAGLWCSVRISKARQHYITNLGEEVCRLSTRTNDISRTYLYHASRGQVSGALANIAASICQGEGLDHVEDKTATAMCMGHNSGMAAVAGLLIGLAPWGGDHRLKSYITETFVSLPKPLR